MGEVVPGFGNCILEGRSPWKDVQPPPNREEMPNQGRNTCLSQDGLYKYRPWRSRTIGQVRFWQTQHSRQSPWTMKLAGEMGGSNKLNSHGKAHEQWNLQDRARQRPKTCRTEQGIGTLKHAKDQRIEKRTHRGPPDREEDTRRSRVGCIDNESYSAFPNLFGEKCLTA